MISTQIVLSAIKTTLDALSADSYLTIAPQNAVYPFVVFSPISNPTEYTFTTVMEDIRMQFSIFDNNSDLATLFVLASTVEAAFEDYNSAGIICAHKSDEVGPFWNEKEHYWQVTMDYIFEAQRNKV